MTHQRKLIRDKFENILKANTNAGDNVFASRVKPISEKKLPAINIQALRENASLYNETKRIYKRTLTVGVALVDRSGDDIDDRLDALAQQVEALILNDETLGGQASDTKLSDTDMRLELGDNAIGGLVISFDVEYLTEHQQTFDDLETLHYALKAGKDSDVISETTVSVPTS